MWPFRKKKTAPLAIEKNAGTPSQGYLPTLGALFSNAGTVVSQATALSVSAVHACVSIRSEDVARCTPKLLRALPDGSTEEVTNHPLSKLFRRPNDQQTWFEFAEQMHAAYLLRSNAYAVILRDKRGTPTQLIPVNPDAVMVLEASDGSILYNVNRVGLYQVAILRDQPHSIPQEDMLHLKGMAFNVTVGASRLAFARDSIGLAIAQDQQAARFISNGARPAGILQTAKSMTQEAAERLKAQWDTLFSGVAGTGSTAVLEGGVEWKPMQLSSADLEFIKQREFSLLEICRWFRMPPHKIGVIDSMSKLNLPQLDQDYVNNTIMPDLDRWEQRLHHVFDLGELEVSFDESRLLRADMLTRINVGRLGVLSGLTSTNEWRRGERLPPVPGGDEVRAPVNTAALGSDTSGTAADGAGRPREGQGNSQDA